MLKRLLLSNRLMKNKIQLIDTTQWNQLKPITFTRSCVDIRLGVFTIKEKWERLGMEVSVLTKPYLQPLYGEIRNFSLSVNSALLPEKSILNEILALNPGESLWQDEIWVATNGTAEDAKKKSVVGANILCYPEDHFIYAGSEIKKDVLLISDQKWKTPSKTNAIIGKHKVYMAEDAKMECCILNTEEGPIYIGPDAHVMEGSILRGPTSIGDNTVVKMGARIYMNTSIGPWCKVGGEIKNSVFLGFSNKAHDGYMGNSVIGEWCNWGADTNNSNMKNNYLEVKLWNYADNSFRNTGHQFVGLMMGDHSKTGINTMFNTGTVIGVSCNIYGTGFPRKFIPSFSWGGVHGFKTYQLKKAIETAEASQKRREIILPQVQIDMLSHLFAESSKYRMWENRLK